MSFSREEVARIFDVPPWMVSGPRPNRSARWHWYVGYWLRKAARLINSATAHKAGK